MEDRIDFVDLESQLKKLNVQGGTESDGGSEDDEEGGSPL